MLLAVLFRRLRLVQSLQRPVMPLVKPPGFEYGQPFTIHFFQDMVERVNRAFQVGRVTDIEVESAVQKQLAALIGFQSALFGQFDIVPAGKQIETVPFAFAVADQNEFHCNTVGKMVDYFRRIAIIMIIGANDRKFNHQPNHQGKGGNMNQEQLDRMCHGKGFIAALDQSGGSTPKALQDYGIPPSDYSGEEQMFDRVHAMRTRVMTSPAFTGEYILAAILFEGTMNRSVDGLPTADYLWNRKQVVPFLKVDKGLASKENGVQLMKPMPGLDDLLKQAVAKNIFGTKMRSVIHEADPKGVAAVVAQQFEVAKQIVDAGLVPIIEPEVNIKSPDKAESEKLLKQNVFEHLARLEKNVKVMFKFSIPTEDDFYRDVMNEPHVVRIVALSGGYSRKEADELLSRHQGLIASFSRALLEGLSAQQNDEEFNATLAASIMTIYNASVK